MLYINIYPYSYSFISSCMRAIFFQDYTFIDTANYKLDKISPWKNCKHTGEAHLNEAQQRVTKCFPICRCHIQRAPRCRHVLLCGMKNAFVFSRRSLVLRAINCALLASPYLYLYGIPNEQLRVLDERKFHRFPTNLKIAIHGWWADMRRLRIPGRTLEKVLSLLTDVTCIRTCLTNRIWRGGKNLFHLFCQKARRVFSLPKYVSQNVIELCRQLLAVINIFLFNKIKIP